MHPNTQQRTARVTAPQWEELIQRFATTDSSPAIRRKHPRFPCGAHLRMAYAATSRRNTVNEQVGTLLDLSAVGMMVRCRTPIPVATLLDIQLFLDSQIMYLKGRVVHCTPTIGACKLGIKLVFESTPPAATDHAPVR